MKKFQTYFNIYFFAFASLLAILFISCGDNSGLGSSVDTKAPVIEITYPPSNATVRNTFIFGGSCSDDKSMQSVLISVSKVISDSETKTVVSNQPATINSNGTWQISLNKYDSSNLSYFNGFEFEDGSYIVSAVAYDKAGHDSGTASRTLNIDNTAPVLLITKPLSIGSETPRPYGRTVQLEGSFSDSCSSIAKLIVSFYDQNGNGLLDAKFQNIIDMSSANPLVLAQYYDENSIPTLTADEQKRWEYYKTLYTDEFITAYKEGKSNTAQIYFTVTAYDAASEYRDFAGKTASASGNATKEFYRSTSDMSKLIRSKNPSFPDFTLRSLQNYLNRSDETYADSADLTAILAEAKSISSNVGEISSVPLAELKNTDAANGSVYLNFTLNPENNPTFSVNGFAIDTSDSDNHDENGYFNYSSGSPISLSVDYGLDKSNLRSSTISIFYTPVISVTNGVPVLDESKKKLFWTWNKEVALQYSGVTESELMANPAQYHYTITDEEETIDSLSVSSSLSSAEVESGKEYQFTGIGTDIYEQSIIPSALAGYGLNAKSTIEVPTLKVDEHSGNNNKNLDNLSIFNESVFKGEAATGKFSFSGTVKSVEELASDAMTYTVLLKDANTNEEASVTGSVTLSNPTIESSQNKYNWSFEFTGTDTKLTNLLNKGNLFTVAVTVYAKNGGGSAKKNFTYYLDREPSTLINLSLSANAAGYSAYSKDGIYYINNEHGTFKLSGTTSDNYKVGEVTYTITGKDSNGQEKISNSVGSESSVTWAFDSIDLSDFASTEEDSDATITLKTVDAAGNESSSALKVKFDKVKPLWTESNSEHPFRVNKEEYNSSNWFSSSSLEVSGCYEENASGVNLVYYWIQSPDGSSPATSNLDSAAGSLSPTQDGTLAYFTTTLGSFEASKLAANGTITPNKLYLVAVDRVGNASAAQSFVINIDQESPSLQSNTSGNVYTNKVADIKVQGTCSDNASGVKSIVLKVGENTLEANITNGTTWEATLSASGSIIQSLSDGSASVEADITDKAGNTSSGELFTLLIDTESPSVKATNPLPASKINGSIKVSGTVNYKDALPASLMLYVSKTKPGNTTKLENLTPVGAEITDTQYIYNWSVSNVDVKTLSGVTEDEPVKDLYIIPVVKDTAGNCSIYTESMSNNNVTKAYSYTSGTNYFAYTVDQNTDRPIIQLTNISSLDDFMKGELKGTVTDDDGVQSFYIANVANPTDSDWKPVTFDEGSTSNWSYTLPSTINDGRNIPLHFKVIDKAGTSFITKNSSRFERPYYLLSNTKASDYASGDYGIDNDSVLSINLDTKAPLVNTPYIAVSTLSSDYDATSNKNGIKTASYLESIRTGDSINDYLFTSQRYAGGNSKFIRFFIPVYDANMKDVTVSIVNASDGSVESSYKDTSENYLSDPISLTATDVKFTADGVEYTYYQTDAIDVSDVATSTKTLTVAVNDMAGNTSAPTVKPTFCVDNNPPTEINITSPAKTDSLTGTVRIVGSASDGTGESGIQNIECLIPPKGYTSSTSDEILNGYEGWTNKPNVGTARAFRFAFVSGTDTDLTQYDDTEKYAVTANDDGTFKIPVLFRLTDKQGNSYIYKDFYITHNPDGDRPVTALSYPTKNNYDDKVDEDGKSAQYVTLAGNIRINGTATVPSNTCGLGDVYIQIGSVDSNGKITWNKNNSALADEFATLGGVKTKTDLDSTYITCYNVPEDWWGIPATLKSKNWSITLNSNSDLNPTGSTTTNIAVRACAINENGKMGTCTDEVVIHVDSNAPVQSAEVRRYKTDNSGASLFSEASPDDNVLSSKEFVADTYLKGLWYLVVTLRDNSYLNSSTIKIQRNGTDLDISKYTKAATVFTYSDNTTSEGDEPLSDKDVAAAVKKIYIPVDTTGIEYKSVTFTVEVSDDADYSSKGTYLFYIDNTAPEISSLSGNGSSLLESTVPSITNSNYFYDLSSTITEAGSGFDKFFFYFLRDSSVMSDGSSSRLLDPMLTYKGEDDDASEYSYTETQGLTSYSISQDSSNSYTLYGKPYTGSLDEDRTSFTADGIKDNKHVRIGGLIYIGGDYQVISSKTGNKVTFANAVSESVESDPSSVTAVFPYGQVINTSDTTGDWDSENFIYKLTSDDGDEMPETVQKDITSWDLSATIYSDRMTDGPVKLVCIAFDAAGNVSGKTVTTSIKNNAPRIAKVYLGTDLSGDGKYTYSTTEGELNEFNEYSFAEDNNGFLESDQYKTSLSFNTNDTNYSSAGTSFKIRKGLVVIPEITGGNGTIKMAWLKNASSDNEIKGSAATLFLDESSTNVTGSNNFTVSKNKNTKNQDADTTHIFEITDTALANKSVNDGTSDMSFTFWDSTEGMTIGSDSQFCWIRIKDFIVDRGDTVSPKAFIDPFYWEGADKNSLYENSLANGHIELETDWKNASGYSSDATSGTADGDPKVSGKITMTGYAYDNQRLSSIWLAFDDFTPANYLTSGGDSSATANNKTAVSGVYNNSGTNGDSKNYYQVAYYTASNGTWKNTQAKMVDDNYEFSVSDSTSSGAYLSQNGHKVIWTFSIDTAKISNAAGLDKNARVIAFDHNGNIVDVSTTAVTTENKPLYKMDVVPYITAVTTTLTASNAGKKGVYDRTARGNYPVYLKHASLTSNEKLTLSGFNFVSGASLKLNGVNAGTLATDYTFTLKDEASSGELSVTVNNVESLNNANNNDSKGSFNYTDTIYANGSYSAYTNYYNRQPNNVNNNNLTDDVKLDVWQFNSEAALAYKNGKVDNLEMKINPKNNMIGFAFSNGTLRFSMPNTDNSYQTWNMSYDYMSHNALAFDTLGYSYGVSVGGDINNGNLTADVYSFMTSRWGIPDTITQGTNVGTSQHLRLDTIGQQITNNSCNRNKARFQNQSFATLVSENATNLYLAYYDLLNGEIRFKAGTINTDTRTEFDNFRDIGGNNAASYANNSKTCQIIASSKSTDDTEKTLGSAGQYVSVGVTSDNVVVIVWYDGTNLMYAYNETPLAYASSNTQVLYAKNTGWEGTTKLISNAGEFCQLAVANDDSIHIACYDSTNADLKYVYIPKYNGSPVDSSVDAYLDVGEQLTIDVAKVGNYQIPYIGYWGAFPEKPRYAYLADPQKFYDNTTKNGEINNTYTGVWECSVVPTQSSVKDQRKMNVGVWKDSSGNLAASTNSDGNVGTSSAGTDNGICYGNGTKNGVMAYVVAPSGAQYNAETAQKK